MISPLLPCCFLDYLGWQLLNQPFLFYIFFASHPCLPRFPHGVYNYFAVSCAFLPPFRPPQSYSRSRYRRPRSHLRGSPRFRPRSRPRSHPVFVYGSPPPSPLPSPFPSCAPSFTSTPVPVAAPSPFPLPLRPRPHDRPRPRYRLRSHPRLRSRPRPRSPLPAPRIRLAPRYDALVSTPGLANGAVGCSQAPPPVCRDGDACGMRVPAVKQKENRRRRRATYVPSARCCDPLEYVSDLCCTRLMASSLMRACTSEPTSPHVDIARGRRE